jgi:hypothetical protein
MQISKSSKKLGDVSNRKILAELVCKSPAGLQVSLPETVGLTFKCRKNCHI